MTQYPICAIATPLGRSAIGIIRLSGHSCFVLVQKIFQPISSKYANWTTFSRMAIYGRIILNKPIFNTILRNDLHLKNKRHILDEIILIPFAPSESYTGEEYIELHCHGNPLILENILQILYHIGFEPAKRGEFTKRALLNNKINLYEAEATREIIDSNNILHLQEAFSLKSGEFKVPFLKIKQNLIHLFADISSELDFIDQDIQFISNQDKIKTLDKLIHDVQKIIQTSYTIDTYKKGYTVVIAGETNTGKSSMFNYLLGQKRALVSQIPGTTRDYLEHNLYVKGNLVNLIDTAGLRINTHDPIEQEGIILSKNKIQEADLLFVVLDGSCNLIEVISADAIQYILKEVLPKNTQQQLPYKYIWVVNKKDQLHPTWQKLYTTTKELPTLQNLCQSYIPNISQKSLYENIPLFYISMFDTDSLKVILETLEKQIQYLTSGRNGIALSAWQKQLLLKLEQNLLNVKKQIQQEELIEVIVSNLQESIEIIGTICGEVSSEDILEDIFKRFCIGK